jgi:hypothetical protein
MQSFKYVEEAAAIHRFKNYENFPLIKLSMPRNKTRGTEGKRSSKKIEIGY